MSNFSVRVMGRSTAEEDEAGASSRPRSETFRQTEREEQSCAGQPPSRPAAVGIDGDKSSADGDLPGGSARMLSLNVEGGNGVGMGAPDGGSFYTSEEADPEVEAEKALMNRLGDDIFGVQQADAVDAEASVRVPLASSCDILDAGASTSKAAVRESLSMANINMDVEASKRQELQSQVVTVDVYRKHVRRGGLCFRKLYIERTFLDTHGRLYQSSVYVGYGILILVALCQPIPDAVSASFWASSCATNNLRVVVLQIICDRIPEEFLNSEAATFNATISYGLRRPEVLNIICFAIFGCFSNWLIHR